MDKKKKSIVIAAVIIILLLLICLIFFLMNKKYTVTFETSAGVTTETQVVKKDDLVKEPEVPTREGYIFAGWYYADDENTKYDFSSKVNKDIKLIAKWEKEDNKITGATISASKSTLEIDEELTLSIKTQPEGVSLEGKSISWTSSDDSVVTVDENGKVKAIKAGTATITVEVDGVRATVGIKVNAKQEEEKEETKNTETKKDTNTSKNNNSTKQTETKPAETKPEEQKPAETKPEEQKPTETKPEETKPEETKPAETKTYSIKWENIEGSVIGEAMLYVVDNNGKKVAGTVTITKQNGKSATVSIPASGKKYVKSTVEASNPKGN